CQLISSTLLLLHLLPRIPPRPLLFPYVTLFRSWAAVSSMLLGKIDADDDTPVAVIAHATSPGGHYDLLLQNNLVELAPEISIEYTTSTAQEPVLYDTALPFPNQTTIPPMTNHKNHTADYIH